MWSVGQVFQSHELKAHISSHHRNNNKMSRNSKNLPTKGQSKGINNINKRLLKKHVLKRDLRDVSGSAGFRSSGSEFHSWGALVANAPSSEPLLRIWGCVLPYKGAASPQRKWRLNKNQVFNILAPAVSVSPCFLSPLSLVMALSTHAMLKYWLLWWKGSGR